MKILIADKFPEKYIEELKSAGHEVTFNPELKADDLAGALNDNEILIVRSTNVRKPTLDTAKNLKLIIRAGSGFNTIDFKEAAEMNIAVANTPGMNAIAVAELTFAHLLSIDRRIPDNVADLKKGVWNKKEYSKADGIFGKTMGIVGIGNIGKEVIIRAKAFGMDVNAMDIILTPEMAKELGVNYYDNLIELVKNSDVITIHLPLIKGETDHMFNAEVFDAMKKGAILIDCSRGGIVDEGAMVKAIEEKGLRVAKDVYENEPEATDKEFKGNLPAVKGFYGSHHIGASTSQAQSSVAQEAVKIIQGFSANREILHKVN